jgi:hypothetical protein
MGLGRKMPTEKRCHINCATHFKGARLQPRRPLHRQRRNGKKLRQKSPRDASDTNGKTRRQRLIAAKMAALQITATAKATADPSLRSECQLSVGVDDERRVLHFVQRPRRSARETRGQR